MGGAEGKAPKARVAEILLELQGTRGANWLEPENRVSRRSPRLPARRLERRQAHVFGVRGFKPLQPGLHAVQCPVQLEVETGSQKASRALSGIPGQGVQGRS